MSPKRVFVTGAAGFIGFHLSKALKSHGHAVTGYDNFNDYYTPALKKARAAALRELDIPIIVGDICEPKALDQAVAEFQPTHIAHLAAQAGVRYSVTHPQAYFEANLNGFGQVLEVCRRHSGVKLIYASSSSVYGFNNKIPFSVSDATDHPASLYAATKKANEVIAYSYHHLYGIPVTGLRFFTVYGPWGRPDMAYWIFTRSILEGTAIDVYHHGDMRRDFTHVDDVVTGIEAALDRCEGCHLYNIGNDQPEELKQLIHLIEDAVGRPAIMRFKPLQPGDVVSTWADIQSSRDELGYAPTISLAAGISQFVQWYKEYAKSPQSLLIDGFKTVINGR